MKRFELKPTKENIFDTFIKDSIGRNKDVCSFISILDSLHEDDYAIAINGGWGCGKTFFIKQVEMILSVNNNFVTNDYAEKADEINKKYHDLCNKYRIQSTEELYLPIYYDAWKYDNDDDPVLSIIYEIISVINNKYDFDAFNVDFKQVLHGIVKLLDVPGLYDIFTSKQEDDELKDIIKSRNLKSKIDEFLEKLPEEKANKIIVFVDELDRCKPTYAIRVLERIKHYFDNERISFVFSTNLEELQFSVKSVYGEGFNAYRYLDRFFDIKIPMPEPDLNRFLKCIEINDSEFYYDKVCKSIMENYHFELRDISKFYRYLKMTTYDEAHIVCYDEILSKTKFFCLRCLAPLLVGLFIYDISLYNSFINGNEASPLLDVFNEDELYDDIVKELIDDRTVEITPSLKKEKLIQLYNALFNTKNDDRTDDYKIGKFVINKKTRKYILEITNLLSDISNKIRKDN